MSTKMIVSDLDGTLFNSDCEGYGVSKELISYIKEFKKKGNIFTIATGRPIETSIEVAKKVGINAPYITYNGAKIADVNGKKIYSERFLLKEILCFLREVEKFGASIILYVNGKILCFKYTQRISVYEKKEITKCEEIDEALFDTDIRVNKVLVIGDVEKYEEMWNDLDISIKDKFRYVISEDDYFEIVQSNISKGSALKVLKNHLNIENLEIIAVGNHMNDKELLEVADVGFAVNNAVDGLKEIADYTTKEEYENGVIEIIKKIME